MTDLLKYLVGLVIGGVGTLGVILLLIYFTPDQAEKWFAMILKGLMKVGIGVKSLHKHYVRHDFQGRVNAFVHQNCSALPGAAAQKVRLEWVDAQVNKQAILDNDTVVVRVRRDDPQERSFVHAVCLFVSKSLLFKAKRYISAPQGEATDLLVSLKLLEREKPAAVAHFVEDYLHPAIGKQESATARVFDDLVIVHDGKLFYSIYLQELNFLGEKVFGGRKYGDIVQEVEELIVFLKNFIRREIGDEVTDLDFWGKYTRFAVVIVGKSVKLHRESIKPYVGFIQKTLIPNGAETIYLLASERNAAYPRQIAAEVANHFDPYLELKYTAKLRLKGGQEVEAKQHLLIIRAKDKKVYVQRAG